MENRKLVKGKSIDVDLDEIFSGKTPAEVIENIVTLSNNLEGESQKFSLYSSYDNTEVVLVSYRYETDKEYERRIKVEEKAKEQKAKLKIKQEESEKKVFERLKKKYES